MSTPQVIINIEMAKLAAAKKVSLKKATRRNQGKLNQRRYRAEQKRSTDLLNQVVGQLCIDVARMEGRLETLRLTIPPALRTFELECKVAEEYIRLFSHGYDLDITTVQHKSQFGFLTNAVSQDLVIMGCVGRAKLIEQWVIYMNTFEVFSMELHNVHLTSFSPNVIVHLDTTLYLRISRKSIQMLFPRLLNDEPLIQRLIGKELHLPTQLRFIFDHKGIVQELGTHVNTTFALVNLFGSVEDTLSVIGGFQMTESAEIVAVSKYP
ncbi:hypothetical protein DYB32_009839 [Aphanomyces invadans]|uniref:BZIP domain-containing protein n=1 Tax=Aphanomyces invadans TaxID=157072 RepID=A0A3R7A2C9_9STRA|nr:hypothetical protein DYB32_009839 [Aphanomyces invadans]